MPWLDFQTKALWFNCAIFIIAAGVVWFAGAQLSYHTDHIANRSGLGKAFAGALLLAAAASLPEIASSVTAASNDAADMAVSNLFGRCSP